MASVTDSPHVVTCAGCGAARPSELASVTPRPPCPECGDTNINIALAMEPATLGFSTKLGLSVGVDHERDWKRRWQEIEAATILGQQPGGISTEAIHTARAELEAFCVACFHLRDHLANDPSVPLNLEQIGAAINATPTLALVADLANVGKHAVLHYTLHSGHEPTIVSERATTVDGSC